jgi:hypothetical protein
LNYVDPIHQWTIQSREITSNGALRTSTRTRWVTPIAAWARICRGYEHEARWESHSALGTSEQDGSVFKGLTQSIKRYLAELWKLVKKQDPVLGERRFPWCGWPATPYQARARNRVVRCPKRSPCHQAVSAQQAGDTVNACHLQGLVERHRGQDRRHAACEHRFSAAWWAYEEYVVSARSSYLKRALYSKMASYLGEVLIFGRHHPQ